MAYNNTEVTFEIMERYGQIVYTYGKGPADAGPNAIGYIIKGCFVKVVMKSCLCFDTHKISTET